MIIGVVAVTIFHARPQDFSIISLDIFYVLVVSLEAKNIYKKIYLIIIVIIKYWNQLYIKYHIFITLKSIEHKSIKE